MSVETIAYLESRGFPKSRMLCSLGGTNGGTRYNDKLVGNSPELMPLDSNLFADLEAAIKQHCAITHDLDKSDPRMAGSSYLARHNTRVNRCGPR